jgi:uncharacterized surface protein with fasciclin (FAS1) repeats
MIVNKMKNNLYLIALIGLTFFTSCQKTWDEHYSDYGPEVDSKMIDYLSNNEEFSDFISMLHNYGLDSLVYSNESKTLFIPTNEALSNLTIQDTTGFMDQILSYHISPTVLLSNNIQNQNSKKLLTSLSKFMLIEKISNQLYADGIAITYSSPLFQDGKYFKVDEVIIPKPSIYGYLELYNPFLKEYIDEFDTLDLDLSLSIPLGYNELGQTIYDSVYNEYNLFEEEFFPISKEFRERTATFILYTKEQYLEAIGVMASNLGIQTSDIPEKWINEVFLSQIFDKSVFEGSLTYSEFKPSLLNIKRDTSFVEPSEIDPDSRFECSNGIVYNFLDFRVPEELYLGKRRFECENYISAIGLGRYVWDTEKVKVLSGISTEPIVTETNLASNDTIVTIPFEFNYTGNYSIEFDLDNIFAGNYLLEWRGNYRPSGNFKVFVNDVDVTNTSPMTGGLGVFDLYLFRNLMLSVETGKYFVPDADRNNSIDFLVQDIITTYGTVKVRIEYQDKGSQSNNGLSIDYLALTPYQI